MENIEILLSLNWKGFLIGLAAFVMIGLFHPIVAKMHYHLGIKSWWMLFLAGIISLLVSFYLSPVYSILAGCLAFSLFWSTHEMFLQEKRVKLGRAPSKPKPEKN
jgi:uncharacterized membrane protein